MKQAYSNGSVFLVPLPSGGFAQGVVTRTAKKGKILVGYFFGPRLAGKAKMNLANLTAQKALFQERFGDLGLFKSHWPVIGQLPDWNPAEWPMTDRIQRDPLGICKPVLVKYDFNDPDVIISEETLENDIDLPSTGLAGYRYVAAKLDKALS